MSDSQQLQELAQKANQVRQLIVQMLLEAGSGHSAGSLGLADVFVALYFGGLLSYDATQPDWSERDYILVSNGHVSPVWYATLALAGFFTQNELFTLRKLGSRPQGHPHLGSLPGVENTSGPLGQGLSQAVGLALALKLEQKANRVVCVMSDAEHQEGQTWEAYQFAGAKRLASLTAIIDRNNIQIGGFTEDIMPLQPLRAKLEAFRWQVLDIDGHDIAAILQALKQADTTGDQPTAIIAHTIPGKDVEFMEHLPAWHGKPPDLGEGIAALQQLRTLSGALDFEG